MATENFIGLSLVLVSVSSLLSLLLGSLLVHQESRLQTLGPWAVRRAATFGLLLPPFFGLGVSVAIAWENVAAFVAGADHCMDHSHHLHLCPIHGIHWDAVPWAVAFAAFFATYVLLRIGQTLWAHWGAQRAATKLKRSGTPLAGFERTFLVPGDGKFAFTTGLFSPVVVISSATWKALGTSERTALLAHEQTHLAHGDLWKRMVLGVVSCFGMPVLAGKLLRLWETASEHLCDRYAVDRVGEPGIVAEAILSIVRPSTRQPVPVMAPFAAAGNIADRIHALFDQPSTGKAAAKTLGLAAAITSALAAITCAFFADRLHHFFETILG